MKKYSCFKFNQFIKDKAKIKSSITVMKILDVKIGRFRVCLLNKNEELFKISQKFLPISSSFLMETDNFAVRFDKLTNEVKN